MLHVAERSFGGSLFDRLLISIMAKPISTDGEEPSSPEEKILDFLRKRQDQGELTPSFREIAEGCFMGRTTVMKYVALLEGAGRIARVPGIPRSIRIIEE